MNRKLGIDGAEMAVITTTRNGEMIAACWGQTSMEVAALHNGWSYIGIDAVPEYIEMSGRRLDHEAGKETL